MFVFFVNTLRRYKPSHLKVMSDADKLICGCEPCGKTDDLNDAYNGKRRKIVALHEIKLEEMDDDNPGKKKLEDKLAAYKKDIFRDDGRTHKYETGWDATEQYGCRKRVEINNGGVITEFPPFACQNMDCAECVKKGYKAPDFEIELCNNNPSETISYSVFKKVIQCNVHGSSFLEKYKESPDAKSKIRCGICKNAAASDKGKIVHKKYRSVQEEKFSQYIAVDGTYAHQFQNMLSHKYRVILFGSQFKKKYRYNYAKLDHLRLKIERDFAERYSPCANKQVSLHLCLMLWYSLLAVSNPS